MSLPLGETFHDFREDKNLSLSQAAGDIVTKSFLSKFEKGGSSISFENLWLLLQRMNVTLSEFVYRAYGYTWTASVDFFHELTRAAVDENFSALDQLIADANARYQKSNLVSDHLNYIVARSVKFSLEDKQLPKEELDYVLDYLFRSEDWLRYDIEIMRFIIPFVPVDTLIQMARALLKHSSDFMKTGLNRTETGEILLNILALLIKNRKIHDAEVLFGLLHRNPTISSLILYSIQLHALKAALWFVSDQQDKGNAEIRWVLDTLHHLDQNRFARQISAQWNDLTGENLDFAQLFPNQQ